MYVLLAGGVTGVGLLVCGVVSAVSIRGRGTEIFSSVPHFLQVGSLLSPIRWRILLRV